MRSSVTLMGKRFPREGHCSPSAAISRKTPSGGSPPRSLRHVSLIGMTSAPWAHTSIRPVSSSSTMFSSRPDERSVTRFHKPASHRKSAPSRERSRWSRFAGRGTARQQKGRKRAAHSATRWCPFASRPYRLECAIGEPAHDELDLFKEFHQQDIRENLQCNVRDRANRDQHRVFRAAAARLRLLWLRKAVVILGCLGCRFFFGLRPPDVVRLLTDLLLRTQVVDFLSAPWVLLDLSLDQERVVSVNRRSAGSAESRLGNRPHVAGARQHFPPGVGHWFVSGRDDDPTVAKCSIDLD